MRLQETLNYLTSEIHKSYSPLFNPDVLPAVREERLAYLTRRYALIEKQLEGRKYLFGDRFTVADAYLFTLTRWARGVKLDLSGFHEPRGVPEARGQPQGRARGDARGGADHGQQGRVNYRLERASKNGAMGPRFWCPQRSSRMSPTRTFAAVISPLALMLGLAAARAQETVAAAVGLGDPGDRSRRRPTASISCAATRWSRCATA